MTDDEDVQPAFVPWEKLSTQQRRRLMVGQALRVVAALVGLFAVYAVVPIGPAADTSVGTVSVLVIGGALFLVLLGRQVRVLGSSAYPVLRAVQSIALIVGLFIVCFALGYLALSGADPAAFTEPLGKVTSLYFTVTVLATVGFGDITASTDGARLLVTLQMVLGLGLIGAVVRYLSGLARSLAGRRGDTTA
jgi:voltage-gated potassium channel